MLGQDVHRDLGEIEVRADPRGRGDPQGVIDVRDHPLRELPPGQPVGAKVGGRVDHHLVDRVDVNILRRDIFKVDLVSPGAVLHVERHAGHRGDVVRLEVRVGRELPRVRGASVRGASGKFPLRDLPEAERVDFLHFPDDLEEVGPPRQPEGLERRRDREADGLLGPRGVRHDQVGGERVEPELPALHGGIE